MDKPPLYNYISEELAYELCEVLYKLNFQSGGQYIRPWDLWDYWKQTGVSDEDYRTES